jgi:thiamine-monophosphate kinase
MNVGDLGERGLIALIGKKFSSHGRGLLLGIGDDAAVVRMGGAPSLLTKDLLVEGVDFLRDRHPAMFIGRKSLAVNLSDIAAMGGTPRYALLGLGLPADLPLAWIRDFLKGFAAAAVDYGVALAGGDISKAAEIIISVTIVGEGEVAIRRSGARPGDGIYVSGTLGDAALGFALIQRGARFGRPQSLSAVLKAFLDPMPQLALGRALSNGRIASAMIDISDGLSVDLRHLCRESGVGAEIELESIPLSKGMRDGGGEKCLDYALNGGEDFQLLFTVRPTPDHGAFLEKAAKRFPITRIGRITAGKTVTAVDGRGRKTALRPGGYEHFRRKGKSGPSNF